MSKRWQLKTHAYGELVKRQYVQTIRVAVTEGVSETVRRTYQDSSNAALHWMVGVSGSRPGSRKDNGNAIGVGVDMRGTKNSPPKHFVVGYRGDEGSNSSLAVKYVTAREFEKVISKHIQGSKPSIDIYLTNALIDITPYAIRAGLINAGELGIQRIINVFQSQTRTRERELK